MKLWAGPVRNEKGVALPLALFALVMLTGLLLAFLSMAGMEPSMAANLSDLTRARYMADAGVEWAYDQLAAAPLSGTGSWSDTLAKGGKMATNQALPGLPASFGTFTITMRNDTLAGDNQITGLAACNAQGATDCGPLLPTTTNDNNLIVIVTATGTLNGGTPNQVQRQIQVVVKRIPLPPFPGTWNCPGLQCDINSGATAHVHMRGEDTKRDGSAGSGPLKFSMTVANGVNPSTGKTYEKDLEDSMTRHHKNEMSGLDQRGLPARVGIQRGSDENCPCEGEYSIAPQSVLPANEQLTPQKIADFINQVKAQGTVNIAKATTGNPIEIVDGKVTAAGPPGGGYQYPVGSKPLGTVTAPTITYVRGTPDATDKAVVKISGNTSGAGILIIEEGNLEISGTLRWDGIILLTGKDVGITLKKGHRLFMYGAMVVNETDATEKAGSYELLIDQSAHLDSSDPAGQLTNFLASQEDLDMVQGLRSLVKITTWREI